LVALLTNDTDPEKGPLKSGAKVIATVRLAPAAIVRGRPRFELNRDPAKFAEITTTEEFPVLVNVTFWEELFPTSTLPNARLVGDTLNRSVGVAVAEPDRLTVGGVFGALLTRVSVPVKVPTPVGANRIVRLADCPAPTAIGKVAPETLKPLLPVTLAAVTDKLVPPLFEIVTVCVEVVLATMLPKTRLVGEMAIWAAGAVTETVTLADADLVLSATLVAFTV
jgi:hypothetical protein